jgi:cholesterol transport system auxiliary component
MHYIKISSLLVVILALFGCASGQQRHDPSIYDFGLPVQSTPAPGIPVNVLVQEISAPAWLATPALHYRLAYRDAAKLQTYANSRWAADPASLLTLRLRQVLGNAAHGKRQFQLHVTLEEFSQVFDSPENSRGLIRARANLSAIGETGPVAARTFTVERKAQTPNAEGGVRALTEASNQLTDEIGKWLIEATLETGKKNK